MTPNGLRLVILGIALTLAPQIQAAKTCYRIDGSEVDDTIRPCNPDADNSGCCATNKDRPDICLSSGLCIAQDRGYEGMIYSNGCTDKTGQADECPSFCPDQTTNFDGGKKMKSWNVLQCNIGNQYCCRAVNDGSNCCDDAKTFSIGTFKAATSTKTATVTQTGDTKITGDSQSDSSATDCASSDAQCPKDNTAVVGGAVGGVLGAALLASLGVIAVLWKKRPHGQAAGEAGWANMSPDQKQYWGYQAQPGAPAVELDARGSPRGELTG